MEADEAVACEACRTSKRRCTKQRPKCRRCHLRHAQCLYQSRPRIIPHQVNDDAEGVSSRGHHPETYDERSTSQASRQQPESPKAVPTNLTVEPQLELHQVHLIKDPACPSLDELRSAWFLSPNDWHFTEVDTTYFTPDSSECVTRRFLEIVRSWLKDWTTRGTNLFIHSNLYSNRMPECMQNAFLALSAYQSRREQNKSLVWRLVEEKANQLIAAEQTSRQDGSDVLCHIARVQGLLIHCMIRLFDEDIRQRHLAEKHLPKLFAWTHEMLRHASDITSNDALLLGSSIANYTPKTWSAVSIPRTVGPEHLLWYAWILSESIRRTACLAFILISGYETMKTGLVTCHGGTLITTRKGVWDAESAFAWTRICAEKSVGYLHRNDLRRLLVEERKEDVDGFVMPFLELDYGHERIEKWALESGWAP